MLKTNVPQTIEDLYSINMLFKDSDFANKLTELVRVNWHVPRWIRRVFGLSKTVKHRLQPRTPNILAHSTFGNGPVKSQSRISIDDFGDNLLS